MLILICIQIFPEGYYGTDYRINFIPSKINKSIYKLTPNPDLEGVGGPWSTTAEFLGNFMKFLLQK